LYQNYAVSSRGLFSLFDSKILIILLAYLWEKRICSVVYLLNKLLMSRNPFFFLLLSKPKSVFLYFLSTALQELFDHSVFLNQLLEFLGWLYYICCSSI
jgi:hypothetical protein